MKNRLIGLLLVVLLGMALSTCAGTRWVPATAADSAAAADAGLPALPPGFSGKYKPNINIYQGSYKDRSTQQGTNGGTYTGKNKPVEKTITKTIIKTTPWYVFAVIFLAGSLLGAWLRGRLPFLSFLK